MEKTRELINKWFDESVIPSLMDYARIPNLSKAFDPDWETNGLLDKAAKHLLDWTIAQNIKGLKLEIFREKGLSPILFGEIEGTTADHGSILFYGHFDKQPHMTGWKEGLGPITPVIKSGKMYGRGVSDDGYSIYATILSIKVLQTLGLPHPKCILLFEGDEESSSGDLEHYFEKFKGKIGTPDIMVILDSGALNYEQLWMTTSLRGVVNSNLTIEMLTDGVHSGNASGLVPSTFRIGRILLDRVECSKTGTVLKDLHVSIPADRYKQAAEVSEIIGKEFFKTFPFVEGAHPMEEDPFQAYLNRTWRPTLSIIGADGLPPTQSAGNVLRASTTLKLSFRLPPTKDPNEAKASVEKLLKEDTPYGAKITVNSVAGAGWNAPPNSKELDAIVDRASRNFYGKPPMYMGEGVAIPFLNFLGKTFPKSQFIVTGVLGPESNAHGPNESLDIEFTKKLICCITEVVAEMYEPLKQK